MRQIIDGKVYDTETAKVVYCSKENDGCNKTLYKKKNGEYFIFTKIVDETLYKEGPFLDIKCWAQNNMPEKDYVKEFGEVCE